MCHPKPRANVVTCTVTVLAALALAPLCRAAERHVPSGYATIQAAIDAAAAGDEVIIAPGTYTGGGNHDIDLRGKAITVRSMNPDDPAVAAATVIDCEDHGRGFYLHSGETLDTVLTGLTVTRGAAPLEDTGYQGGGILCINASPTITHCIIEGNRASVYCAPDYEPPCYTRIRGGGLCCIDSSPRIEACTIRNNRVTNDSPVSAEGSYGGGLYLSGGSNPTIAYCVIEDNLAAVLQGPNAAGGGVYCDAAAASISNCTIRGNIVSYGSFPDELPLQGGGGCYVTGTATISDCTISGNGADNGARGGGLFGGATVIRCIITDNWSFEGGGVYFERGVGTFDECTILRNEAADGGAIAVWYNAQAIVRACRISGNTVTFAGGAIHVYWQASSIIHDCLITGNVAMNGSALFVIDQSSLDVRGCTLSGNQSPGGAVEMLGGSSLMMANCVLWDRLPHEVYVDSGTATVVYSDIWGGELQSWFGVGCTDLTPRFVDPDGPDDDPTTWQDNDYHLGPASPCINAGDPAFVPAPGETDLDGRRRITYGRVDMGAYEYTREDDRDLDFDGDVDLADFALFQQCFNGPNRPPTEGCADGADFDSDGDVDLDDFSSLQGCFNGPNRPPACQ